MIVCTVVIIVGILSTTTIADFPRTLSLSSTTVDRPPFSRVLLRTTGAHDIPAGGAILPTAIFYANIQIGTPSKDFAVGIDSGSGDLFVEGKGCGRLHGFHHW